jgi:hypothetical protein
LPLTLGEELAQDPDRVGGHGGLRREKGHLA